MISVNQRATAIVQEMIGACAALGLSVTQLSNGTTVLDAGVEVPVWPTRRTPDRRLTREATRKEVQPAGLSTLRKPDASKA
jgi:hypothetical protein